MTPEPAATAYYRVFRRLDEPIVADVGDVLAIMPPPCPHNLWVHEPRDLWVVRRAHLPEPHLWSTIFQLLESGAIHLLHVPSLGVMLPPRRVYVAAPSPLPALRLVK